MQVQAQGVGVVYLPATSDQQGGTGCKGRNLMLKGEGCDTGAAVVAAVEVQHREMRARESTARERERETKKAEMKRERENER